VQHLFRNTGYPSNIRCCSRSSDQQQSTQKQQQSSGKSIHQHINYISGQSMQQIMIELSGAAREKEKVAVITKAVFGLLKNNENNGSQTSENHCIQC
jgi:hypothetical protein